LAAFVVGGALSGNVCAEAVSPDYELIDTLHLSGSTHWDYLAFDLKGHRLFITRGESVEVLDVATKKIVGSIPNTSGVHGVALAYGFGKGFVSDGKANTVTVFDLTTLKSVATVPTGNKPDAIVYDVASKRVFAANGNSGDMTAISAKDETIAGTIKLDGKPEFAVVDGKGRLYVNLEDKSQLAVVDTNNLKVIAHYNLAPNCDSPTGLAIDTSLNRLFSVCENKAMVVVQADTGKIIDTLAIGAHSDAAIFDPGVKLAFSSNGDGTLTIVGLASSGHYTIAQNVATVPTARTMALDPSTHRLYLAAAETEGFDPPTAKNLEPHPHIKPDTFMILTVGQKPSMSNP
jgi:YVTN family beta-propeller protein